jgi:hypothetical protein
MRRQLVEKAVEPFSLGAGQAGEHRRLPRLQGGDVIPVEGAARLGEEEALSPAVARIGLPADQGLLLQGDHGSADASFEVAGELAEFSGRDRDGRTGDVGALKQRKRR